MLWSGYVFVNTCIRPRVGLVRIITPTPTASSVGIFAIFRRLKADMASRYGSEMPRKAGFDSDLAFPMDFEARVLLRPEV